MGRSSRVVLVLCWLVLLMVPSGVRADGNLVVNGDFEIGSNDFIDHWVKDLGLAEVSILYNHTPEDLSGKQSMHLVIDQGWTQYHQAASVPSGRAYVTGWALTTGVQEGRIGVAPADDDSCNIQPDLWTTVVLVNDQTPSGEWQQGTIDLNVDSPYLCVFIRGEENELYFDDISVAVVPPTAVGLGGLRASGGVGVMVALGLAAAAATLGRSLRRVRR